MAAEAAVASEQAPEADNIIVARDVHKWFGDFHALRGVTTSVRRSEVVVVIGPSGSGKSTFIRAINRLEQHQRGDIIVDGVEMTDDVRNIDAIRREVGMVFQSFNLFPHLTVLRNITLAPTKVRKTPLADAENSARELLERVGIPEQADKYPGELSVRSAAACRHRPCAGDAAQDHALRRAHVGSGPGDDQGSPGSNERTGFFTADDHRSNHARVGICPRSGRPHRHVRRGSNRRRPAAC